MSINRGSERNPSQKGISVVESYVRLALVKELLQPGEGLILLSEPRINLRQRLQRNSLLCPLLLQIKCLPPKPLPT